MRSRIQPVWRPENCARMRAAQVRDAILNRWDRLSPGQRELIELWMDTTYVDDVDYNNPHKVADYL